MAGQYGYSLNQRKSIDTIMERNFLEVDAYTPISLVSAMAMKREEDKLYDFIVVIKEGKI